MKKSLLPPFLLMSSLLLSQSGIDRLEQGNYTVENYSPEVYQAHFQNWDITKDKNGFVYAANGEGVLEFDGSDWRLIRYPSLNSVRTVVVDDANVKWVGGDRELGFLQPDSLGSLQYISLKDKIPESTPLSANIWQIFPENGRVIFASDNALYSWEGGKFNIIPHPGPGPIHREYQIHGTVYVSIAGEGMFQVRGNTLVPIPGGEMFKDIRASVGIPYGRDQVLFATKGAGLYVYDGNSIDKLDNGIEAYLQENLLYAGVQIDTSMYAFATLRGGVIFMDGQGNHLRTITEDDGIANNQVHGLMVDDHKTLWLALQTGISKIGPMSPNTFFDHRNGLEGTVTCMARYQGDLYVGTYSGLFVLERNLGPAPSKLRKIEAIKSGCFSLLEVGESLLAATANGVFKVENQMAIQINEILGCRTLCVSKRNPNRIFVGHMHGVSSLYRSGNTWLTANDLGKIKEDIRTIEAEENGIWLGSTLNMIINVAFPKIGDRETDRDLDLSRLQVTRYHLGLPDGPTNMWLIDGEVMVTSDGEGGPLFKLDTDTGIFSPDTGFPKKFGLDSIMVYPRAYQEDGKYVLLESTPVDGRIQRYTAIRGMNQYTVKRLYDEQNRSPTETLMFWEGDALLWSGGEQLSRMEMGNRPTADAAYQAYVRRVSIGEDSLLFGGVASTFDPPSIGYAKNNMRFGYAAPNLPDNEGVQYQYRLEGMDPDWSNWTQETKKDYTALFEGNYQFQVRARDVFGNVSLPGTFDFEVLPPWFRTWWAYLSYLLLLTIFLWALLRWRSKQLKAQNQALEKLIAVRTSEVRHQANQLRIQAEKLQELDKAKSRFFANISHEFRTPLTLIKGPIEQLEQNFTEKLDMETVQMIRRNANRLLHMVNQLLDLSKIDEGSLTLVPTEGDVHKCLRAAASSFNSHAAQRLIDYRVDIPNTPLWAAFDRDKLENIVYNLLGNAFKFSEDHTRISFMAEYTQQGLELQVSDEGKGISVDKLPFIFNRFYQVDGSNTREKGGSGIGLSLSKDLVTLMDGSITVSSKEGQGTRFVVHLPIQEIKTGQKEIPAEVTQIPSAMPVKSPFQFAKSDQKLLPTVLLVEDNVDMRQFISEQLMRFYKIKVAINGEVGLQKAIKDPPDLVITDLMMPKMDGIELCTRLKTDLHTSHIPVIMLTAKAGIDNKLLGLETGADDYLIKPFNAKELLVRIKNLIEQRQKLRSLFANREISVDPKQVTVTSIDQKFLEKLLQLLEERSPDPEFGLPDMQVALAMSKTQLHRKIKALTNEAPGEVLRNFRLKRAAQLLSQKEDSVTQIAYKVGFNNLSYFAKCFKERYGVAPSSY